MTKLFNANKRLFCEVSKTEAGPYTDGKSKRKKSRVRIERSFNDAFCKNYFIHDIVRESFYLYTQLIFSEFDLPQLIEKFQFSCCQTKEHDIDCIEK